MATGELLAADRDDEVDANGSVAPRAIAVRLGAWGPRAYVQPSS